MARRRSGSGNTANHVPADKDISCHPARSGGVAIPRRVQIGMSVRRTGESIFKTKWFAASDIVHCFGSVFIWYGSGSAEYRSGSGSNPDPGFWWKKIEKKFTYSWKIICGSKTTINLSLGLHNGRSSYRLSLQLSKENIQHSKTWNFFIFFYFCGSFSFCPPGSGYGSSDLIESGSNPDSKHCGIIELIQIYTKPHMCGTLFAGWLECWN